MTTDADKIAKVQELLSFCEETSICVVPANAYNAIKNLRDGKITAVEFYDKYYVGKKEG